MFSIIKFAFKTRKLLFFLIVLNEIFFVFLNILATYIFGFLIDIVNRQEIKKFTIYIFLSIIFLISILLSQVLRIWLRRRYMNSVLQILRERILMSLTRRNLSIVMEDNSGKYISWLTNDVDLLRNSFISVTSICYSFTEFLTLLTLSFILSAWVTTAVVSFSFLFFVTTILIQKRVSEYGQKISNNTALSTSKIEDITDGYLIFQLANKSSKLSKIFNIILNNIYKKLSNFYARISFIQNIFSNSLFSIFRVFITLLTAFLIFSNKLFLSSFFIFINIFGMIISAFSVLFYSVSSITSVKNIFKRFEPLKENFSANLPKKFETLRFKNIDLSYEDKIVFKGLNLRFEKRKKYAIIGKSGCGKSSLIRLLFALVKQQGGEILWDDISLKDVNPKEIRDRITFVSSNFSIFDATVSDNITFFKEAPNTKMIEEILKTLNLNLKPEQQVSKNSLSKGQIQRLVFARALYFYKDFLILDEALANLDSKNAKRIEDYLLKDKELTLINITHHLQKDQEELYDEVINLEKLVTS